MKLKQLPPVVVSTLMARLSDEQTARYFYEAAASWCQNNGYHKAAKYFLQESVDESSHAAKIIKFLSDWNVPVKFSAINAPEDLYGYTLLEVIEKAYEIEYDLLEAYDNDARAVFNFSLEGFNIHNEFVSIQNESVIEYADLINKANNYLEMGKNLALFEHESF